MSAPDAPSWSSFKAQGNAAYTGGRTEEACEHYTSALQCADVPAADRATLLCNRAQAYLKLARHEAAVEDCTACLTLSPENIKALYRRGMALEAVGDQQGALRDYRDVVRLSPAIPDAGEAVARLEAALGIAPSAVAPSGGVRLELSEEEMRSLQEVTARAKDVRRQKARAQAQHAHSAKERRSLGIQQSTLAQLPPKTRAFRAIGRLFLHTQREELDTLLAERVQRADAKVKVCESTLSYLNKQEEEADSSYAELVQALQRKRAP